MRIGQTTAKAPEAFIAILGLPLMILDPESTLNSDPAGAPCSSKRCPMIPEPERASGRNQTMTNRPAWSMAARGDVWLPAKGPLTTNWPATGWASSS